MNPTKKPDCFTIRFTQTVTFRDMHGNVQKVYNIGDVCEAYGPLQNVGSGQYYSTGMGGIYLDEAEEID